MAGTSKLSREALMKAWSMFSCRSCSQTEDFPLCHHFQATRQCSLVLLAGEIGLHLLSLTNLLFPGEV